MQIVAITAMAIAAATSSGAASDRHRLTTSIDSYVRPYAATRNFAGAILVDCDGKTLYRRGFGYADRNRRVPNGMRTRFHVASMSMQFTAAAVLRLVEAGALSLDTNVAAILPDYPNGSRITVRHLLTQTSGIADINNVPDYEQILTRHQEPVGLVARVKGLPVRQPPGGAYTQEEHSAYNLLALIIERKTRLSFALAMQQLVFRPLGMADSGIDDDRGVPGPAAAGMKPLGVFDLEPAQAIHWSAKAGSGSAYTTALDEQKWVRGLFAGSFLGTSTRGIMFDLSQRVGYGWFKSQSQRFGTPAYSMNARAPGFASAILYYPALKLTVVVLSNIYASVPTRIGIDVAALALGKPVDKVKLMTEPLSQKAQGKIDGNFMFGKDFYQPSATLTLQTGGAGVRLRWPTGDQSPLIPVDRNHFIDRFYWVPVELIRDETDHIVRINYDDFVGARVK